MKNAVKVMLVCIIVPLMFSSCASIVSRSKWPLTINTNPNGAIILITDKTGKTVYNGVSPITVDLKSGAGFFSMQKYTVKISMAGYTEKVIPVSCNLNGWYLGNIIFGGLIGILIVDPATGAMYKLDTANINETLVKNASSVENKTLKIINYSSISEDMKSHLVRIN